MDMESKDKDYQKKKVGARRLISVIKYSLEGIRYFFKYERSAVVYVIAAIIGITGAWMLQMSPMEWLVILFVLLTTLAVELLNTAIEAICDLVSPEYNPLVKIAKDCGSGATFVLSVVGIVVGLIMYVPKIIEWIELIW